MTPSDEFPELFLEVVVTERVLTVLDSRTIRRAMNLGESARVRRGVTTKLYNGRGRGVHRG
jgi:hypothetical protein